MSLVCWGVAQLVEEPGTEKAAGTPPTTSRADHGPVDAAVKGVDGSADRLHRQRVHQVAGDGDLRVHLEQQHQCGRH